MDVEKKRQKEQEMVSKMIHIYCHGKHKTGKRQLCDECLELHEYAMIRVQKCPFMETKSFCSACKVHCYTKDKAAKIKNVMKYSGPRMLYHHPLTALKHIGVTIKEKGKKRVS